LHRRHCNETNKGIFIMPMIKALRNFDGFTRGQETELPPMYAKAVISKGLAVEVADKEKKTDKTTPPAKTAPVPANKMNPAPANKSGGKPAADLDDIA
jgi:hypothetical protein